MDRDAELRQLVAGNLHSLTQALVVIDGIAARFPHLSSLEVIGEIRRQQHAAAQQVRELRHDRQSSLTSARGRAAGHPWGYRRR